MILNDKRLLASLQGGSGEKKKTKKNVITELQRQKPRLLTTKKIMQVKMCVNGTTVGE